MRAKAVCFLISFALLASTAGGWAKSFPSAGITRDEMAAYLTSKGYPATSAFESGNNHRILKTTIDGVDVDVYFLDCETDDAGRCASIQLASSWSMSSPDIEKVNSWNRLKRFMRAYLTESKTTMWAEYDMFIAPDGSTDLLDRNLTMWRALNKGLKAHFGF
jgi:hypothetical protein